MQGTRLGYNYVLMNQIAQLSALYCVLYLTKYDRTSWFGCGGHTSLKNSYSNTQIKYCPRRIMTSDPRHVGLCNVCYSAPTHISDLEVCNSTRGYLSPCVSTSAINKLAPLDLISTMFDL